MANRFSWYLQNKQEITFFYYYSIFVSFTKCNTDNRGVFLPSPVIGDDVHIHLVGAFSILSQVADGFPMRLLVAVNPVEPHLLLLHLLLQQRGLQGGLRAGD